MKNAPNRYKPLQTHPLDNHQVHGIHHVDGISSAPSGPSWSTGSGPAGIGPADLQMDDVGTRDSRFSHDRQILNDSREYDKALCI